MVARDGVCMRPWGPISFLTLLFDLKPRTRASSPVDPRKLFTMLHRVGTRNHGSLAPDGTQTVTFACRLCWADLTLASPRPRVVTGGSQGICRWQFPALRTTMVFRAGEEARPRLISSPERLAGIDDRVVSLVACSISGRQARWARCTLSVGRTAVLIPSWARTLAMASPEAGSTRLDSPGAVETTATAAPAPAWRISSAP